jgi:hypothetical protein
MYNQLNKLRTSLKEPHYRNARHMGNIPLCCARQAIRKEQQEQPPVDMVSYYSIDSAKVGSCKGEEPSIYDGIFSSIHDQAL